MRTELAGTKVSLFTGKWCAVFNNWNTARDGEEYIGSSVESAAVFDTSEEAYAGGVRALATLNETGRYPNMCEPF